MADTLDTLNIVVEANGSVAVNGIQQLTTAVTGLKQAAAGGFNLSAGIGQLTKLAEAIKSVDLSKLTKIRDAANTATAAPVITSAVGKAAATPPPVSTTLSGATASPSVMEQGATQISQLATAVTNLKSQFENASGSMTAFGTNINKVVNDIKQLPGEIRKTATSFSHLQKTTTKTTSAMSKLFGIIKRIALFKAIRGIIGHIARGIREGLENAVAFSRIVGGEMAKALDSIASKSGVMKNQLGASLGELLQTLQPILEAIISIITRIAQAMSQLFALLGGRSTWQKATGAVNQWGKAAGGAGKAAKEWKNQLLGFDEINRLNDQNSGGGGGGGGNNGIGGWNVAEELSAWAKELQALLKTAFMTGDFFDVGSWIGEKISLLFNKYTEWLEGIDWHKIGTSITSFIIGTFDGIDWGSISRAFSVAVRSGLDLIGGLIDGVDWYALPGRIAAQIQEFVSGADWASLLHHAGEIIGKALIAAINFAKGLWDTILKPKFMEFLPDNFDDLSASEKFFAWGAAIIKGIILGFGEALIEFPTTVKEMLMQGVASAFGKEEEWVEMGKTPGGQVIKGLIFGLSSTAGVSDPVSTLIYNIRKLFTDGFEIGSPSKFTEGVGQNLIQGLINGIDSSWSGIQTKLQTLFDGLKTWWQGLKLGSFHINMPHIETTWESVGGILADWLGITAIPHFSVSWYASGGFPTAGQLFIANEHGPEMVGSMDGRSAVANNDQIVEGIEAGVYRAMTAAMQNGSFTAKVYLDGREIKTSQTRLARAMGV